MSNNNMAFDAQTLSLQQILHMKSMVEHKPKDQSILSEIKNQEQEGQNNNINDLKLKKE